MASDVAPEFAFPPAASGVKSLGRASAAAGGLVAPWEVLRAWRFRRRYRADLRRLLLLGPHLIEDIGLGLKEAVGEAPKPFWRA